MTEAEQIRALKSVCRNLVDNLDQPTLLKDAGPAESMIRMAIAQLTDVLRATETPPSPLQLYVWAVHNISPGAGLAFAIASSEEDARALVLANSNYPYSDFFVRHQFDPPTIYPLDAPIGFGAAYEE